MVGLVGVSTYGSAASSFSKPPLYPSFTGMSLSLRFLFFFFFSLSVFFLSSRKSLGFARCRREGCRWLKQRSDTGKGTEEVMSEKPVSQPSLSMVPAVLLAGLGLLLKGSS